MLLLVVICIIFANRNVDLIVGLVVQLRTAPVVLLALVLALLATLLLNLLLTDHCQLVVCVVGGLLLASCQPCFLVGSVVNLAGVVGTWLVTRTRVFRRLCLLCCIARAAELRLLRGFSFLMLGS